MYSTIARSKFGDCTICPAKDVPCVKIGKELVCLDCNKTKKTLTQIDKAKERDKKQSLSSKVRGLINSEENKETGSRVNLINDCDFYTSRIVRQRGMDKDGIQTCYTCGFKAHWQQLQNSHFISRSCLFLRFDTKYNCKPGCVNCNVHKHGNLEEFKKNLELEMPGITTTLYEQSKEVIKITNDDLKVILQGLREELKIIESKFKK